MKVFFINNGMTYYYNLVLSKLSEVKGIELTLIIPAQVSPNIGEGVYQTREGVSFRVLELQEYTLFGLYSSFRGLDRLFLREKPDIVIVADTYLFTFLFNIPVVLTKKLLGIKLIMKSIPFRVPTYQEAKRQLKEDVKDIKRISKPLNIVLSKSGLSKLLRRFVLYIRKIAYNIPDAHVNYIDEAFDVYGSYGVPKEKIFITRNSPDTDILFEVRKSLESVPPILPPCDHRLIHVGRLVEWKRVDLLLRAFARIKKSFTGAELLVIGNGPERESLERLSDELGVSEDVKFLGGVYDPYLLGRYLMSSSVYVLAGMGGLSINDAMCFGLPIICSVCDGTEKSLVRDGYNGKYFKDGDEDDLVEKIIYLFENPELRKSMGINSTNIIRDEININTVITGYTRAFKYAVGGKRARGIGAIKCKHNKSDVLQ